MQRRRPNTILASKITNATLGLAILLYGYQTPTLTILCSALQVSDGETLKNNVHELQGFYGRMITNYSNDIALIQKDTNHIGHNILLFWQHAIKTGDIKRIQVR